MRIILEHATTDDPERIAAILDALRAFHSVQI